MNGDPGGVREGAASSDSAFEGLASHRGRRAVRLASALVVAVAALAGFVAVGHTDWWCHRQRDARLQDMQAAVAGALGRVGEVTYSDASCGEGSDEPGPGPIVTVRVEDLSPPQVSALLHEAGWSSDAATLMTSPDGLFEARVSRTTTADHPRRFVTVIVSDATR